MIDKSGRSSLIFPMNDVGPMHHNLASRLKQANVDNYSPQRSWGKVMFLHVCVILFTGGGAASVHAGGTHPTRMQSSFIQCSHQRLSKHFQQRKKFPHWDLKSQSLGGFIPESF